MLAALMIGHHLLIQPCERLRSLRTSAARAAALLVPNRQISAAPLDRPTRPRITCPPPAHSITSGPNDDLSADCDRRSSPAPANPAGTPPNRAVSVDRQQGCNDERIRQQAAELLALTGGGLHCKTPESAMTLICDVKCQDGRRRRWAADRRLAA